jgi:dienelactone hydrolase
VQHFVVQLDLVDSSRPTAEAPGRSELPTRSLPTTVYLPAATDPAALIVLAHGASGSPEKFTDLASYWADHGYVVAVPRFPLTNDTVSPPVIGDFVEQAGDVQFVLTEVLASNATGGELAGRIDPERLGLYGLSLGSMTVWTAVAERSSTVAIDALIQSDGYTLVDDDELGRIGFPVFVAHSDVDPIFPYADTLARYDALPEPKYLLTLHGAGHATVGENTITPADDTYRRATTTFWDRTLGGRPEQPFPADVDGVTSFVVGARPAQDVLPGSL